MEVSVWNDLKFIVVLFWHDFGQLILSGLCNILLMMIQETLAICFDIILGNYQKDWLHVCPYQTELQYLLNLDVSFFQTTPENKLKSHKTVFWIDGYFLSSIFLFLIINKDSFALYVYIWG